MCEENVNVIQFSPLNQWNNKYTWFSRKIFVFCSKWKIKNVVVLDMWSATHLEAFLIKQGVLFLHVSNVLQGVSQAWFDDVICYFPNPSEFPN